MINFLTRTTAPRSIIFIRLMIGLIFMSEGVQKFIFPESLGPGRFENIGFMIPDILACFVACVEITAGLMVILGLLTRIAALALAINMTVAILSTKIPILLGHGYWFFHVRQLSRYGFWAMAHESRTDLAMLAGSLFLLVVGAGAWSLDNALNRRLSNRLRPQA